MEIRKPAVVGTLESSGCQVTMESGEENIELASENVVISQYGDQIKRMVVETLGNLGMKDMRITIVDKGALDYTIRARVEDAVFHAAGQYDSLPWRDAIR